MHTNLDPSDPVRRVMSTPVVELPADTTIRTAAMVMRDKEIGAVVVTGARGLVGVASERDVVQALATGVDPDLTWTGAVMSDQPLLVEGSTTIGVAVDLMLEVGIRHLPVVQDGQVIGMVSIRDALAAFRGDRDAVTGDGATGRAR